MATSKSGKEVLAARIMAAWTEIQDLRAMLRKRARPAAEMLASQPKTEKENSAGPGDMKITGRAARMKGSARAARFSTMPMPRPEMTAAARTSESSRR